MVCRITNSDPPHSNFDASFSAFFKNHFDILFNYGKHLTHDDDIVKDCIQELFFKIWKNQIDYRNIKNTKAYLIKSFRNQLLNTLELKHNTISKTDIEESFKVDFSPEDYYISNQQEEITRNRVIKALNQLSAKQKEAIYLRFFEDLNLEEISEIMKINIQSVKNNLQRAFQPLREYLGRFSLFIFSIF